MEPERLRGGELQAALSNAIVRIMREFYGKGAARSRTMLFDEYVFVVLEDVLTTAEMTLRDGGAGALVQRVRLCFEDLMTETFVGEVERLTGRAVVGYHSQLTLEPPSCFEIFILDTTPDPPSERHAAARAAVSNAVVRLMTDLYGKGAARTRTFIADDHAFCALEGILTTVERTLIESGETDLVRELRVRFCEMVRPVITAEVAPLLGRQVLAMESQVVFDPDTLFLIFVLGDGR